MWRCIVPTCTAHTNAACVQTRPCVAVMQPKRPVYAQCPRLQGCRSAPEYPQFGLAVSMLRFLQCIEQVLMRERRQLRQDLVSRGLHVTQLVLHGPQPCAGKFDHKAS